MSINKPRYYNRITGKAVAKIKIEFTITDDTILFALSSLIDFEKPKNITRQDVINKIKLDKKEYGDNLVLQRSVAVIKPSNDINPYFLLVDEITY